MASNIVSLDPAQIQASLIQFLQSQNEFSDYNFQGSGLNVLLTLLSFNTTYFGYYLNMVAKECFLDSATIRDSVISLAKQLNYTPTSSIAAKAVVNIIVTPGSSPPAFLTLPRNSIFTAALNGTSYNFVNREALTVPLLAGVYTFNNVVLQEGNPYLYQYTVNSSNPVNYIIPSASVDTSTLSVSIQNSSANNTTQIFSLVDLVSDLTPTSKVYYLQEVQDGYYQVYFGNNVLGAALFDGNVVNLDYLVCSGSAPNQINSFTLSSSIGGFSNLTVTTVTPAYGGQEPESIQSIQFNAPKVYESQNRAVTENDYASIIQKYFNNIQSISVWGGEKNIPPANGQVFISIQPANGYFLTAADKNTILDTILGPRGVLNITPQIVDPFYVYVVINSLVKYNQSLTNQSNTSLQNEILNTITQFNTNTLNKFKVPFLYSALTSDIDSADPSIISNLTNIQLKLNLVPVLNVISNYTLSLGPVNPIKPGTVSSTSFVVKNDTSFAYTNGDIYYFDDLDGSIRIYKLVNGSKVVMKANSGTVDYINGQINITGFIPFSLANNSNLISIFVEPVFNDVSSFSNNIITIAPNDITVNLVSSV